MPLAICSGLNVFTPNRAKSSTYSVDLISALLCALLAIANAFVLASNAFSAASTAAFAVCLIAEVFFKYLTLSRAETADLYASSKLPTSLLNDVILFTFEANVKAFLLYWAIFLIWLGL